MNNKVKNTGTSLTVVILFVAIFIVVNVFATNLTDKFPLKLDLTEEKIYEISDETKSYLDKLDKDINVYLFVNDETTPNSIKEITDRYCKMSNKLHLEMINYIKNPGATTKYTSLGKTIGTNTVVFDSGDKFKVLEQSDLLAYNYFSGQNDLLVAETKFTTAVMTLMRNKNVNAAFITGHGELSPEKIKELLDENSTDYKEVNISKGELNEEYDMAVIVAPQTDYTAEEIDALNSYLKSGKDLEVFLDFSSEKLTKLETYLEEWGIKYEDNIILEGDTTRIIGQQPYYISPELSEHAVTNSLINGNILPIIPASRSITVKWDAKNGTTVETIAKSSEKSYAKKNDSMNVEKEASDQSGPFSMVTVSTNGDTNVIAFGSSTILNPAMATYNKDLIYNTINWATTQEEPLDITPKSLSTPMLKISNVAMYLWFILLTIIVPLCILLYGVKVWYGRRHL